MKLFLVRPDGNEIGLGWQREMMVLVMMMAFGLAPTLGYNNQITRDEIPCTFAFPLGLRAFAHFICANISS